jgi:hypothetical protein
MKKAALSENFLNNIQQIEDYYLKENEAYVAKLKKHLFIKTIPQVIEFPLAFKEVINNETIAPKSNPPLATAARSTRTTQTSRIWPHPDRRRAM